MGKSLEKMADYGAAEIRPARVVRDSLSVRCEKYFAELDKWEVWRSILLGQILSLLLCTTAVISQVLSTSFNVAAPTAQSFLNYVLLCMVFTTTLACRPGEGGLLSILKQRGWKYFFLALADVEANYLVVKAYQYTTLTSVQLLDCFTIPVVLLLSWAVLRVRYQIIHIIGVSVCLMGIGCLVWADADEQNKEPAKNRLLGDLLCMGGAFLYGLSNVAEEFVVKTLDSVEFLGMVGLFGSVINGIQLATLEHEQVASIDWSDWRVVVLLLAFAGSLFAYYVATPMVLKITSATAVNLSLLSADFYALFAGILLFQFTYHALYTVSFALVILGVVVFCARPAPINSQHIGYRSSLPRTVTTTTTATTADSSHDLQLQCPLAAMQGIPFPPPPPPPPAGFATPTNHQQLHHQMALPVYNHNAEMTYGTYRRKRAGDTELKDRDSYQVSTSSRLHVEEQTTSFDSSGRIQTHPPPAPERALLGGRSEGTPTPGRTFSPNSFTQTVTLKLPPSPGPNSGSSSRCSRVHLPHCTLPRQRPHKEVTFNPHATFQVYRRPSACYDGDEQL